MFGLWKWIIKIKWIGGFGKLTGLVSSSRLLQMVLGLLGEIVMIDLSEHDIWSRYNSPIQLQHFLLKTTEIACCVSQQHKGLMSKSFPFIQYSHCTSFYAFSSKVLQSISNSKTGAAWLEKRLFIWKVEWWPVCCSNNISRLLSPAVMRGSANLC